MTYTVREIYYTLQGEGAQAVHGAIEAVLKRPSA